MDWLKAAIFYFASVFAAGAVLGSVRELLVKPWAGGLGAILLEAPIILAAMIYLAPRTARWAGLGEGVARHAAMGFAALALLLVFEAAAAQLLRGWSLGQWLRHFDTPEGRAAIALYVVFALVPLFSRATVSERGK
ncbi:MAG: hypothetical protein H6876_02015 [Hyphomicrobiaceae bacterium]|nr:hypothetical protein [Hyphomicrobiaceae bacterium]MCC0006886.1 hypothetical protein [Hyphomicrobiaceae bacterium]